MSSGTCGSSGPGSATGSRFGSRSRPEVLQTVVPVLSIQPLVENAVRHGVEQRGRGRIEIVGRDIDADVELRVSDDGVGMPPGRGEEILAGNGGGIGLINIQSRLHATFGSEYGLEIELATRPRHDRDDDGSEVPRGGARGVNAGAGLRVLAVDDERPALEDLARLLDSSSEVSEVVVARSGGEALRTLADHRFDAIFLDVRMPEIDGLELASVLDQFADPPSLVFVSAYEDGAVGAFELELHPLDYLMKPVSRATDRAGARAGGRGAVRW